MRLTLSKTVAYYLAILAASILLHALSWFFSPPGAGRIAGYPTDILPHIAGIGFAYIIISLMAPLILGLPMYVHSLIKGRSLTARSGVIVLLKAGFFIGVFCIWIPWEVWFK